MDLKNVKRTNAFFLGLILIYLAAELFITVLSAGNIEISLISSLCLSQGVMIVPAMLFLIIFRPDVRAWIPFRMPKWSTLGLTVLFTLCISPFVTWINLLSQLFTTNIVAEMAEEFLSSPPLPLLLIIGIIGPFCEEATFRGIIFHGLRFSGRILAAILVSGLYFGLMHMNLNQFCYAFFLGVAFGLLTEATGSIVPSFLVHICINSFNVGLEFAMDFIYTKFSGAEGAGLSEAMGNTEISRNELLIAAGGYMIPALVGLALAIVVFIEICKKEGTISHIQEIFHSSRQMELSGQQSDSRLTKLSGQQSDSRLTELSEQQSDSRLAKQPQRLPVITAAGWIAIGICVLVITATDFLMNFMSMFFG